MEDTRASARAEAGAAIDATGGGFTAGYATPALTATRAGVA